MALALRKEEGLGLGIAVAAHAALLAVLLLRPQAAPVVQPPERIEVTISDEVGLTSTSPEANSQAAPVVAPELGEPQPAGAEAAPAEAAEAPPEPVPAPPIAKPAPPKPEPRKVEQPAPRPSPKPQPKPQPKPAPPKPAPTKPAPSKAAPAKAAPKAAPKPAEKAPAQKAPAQKAPAQKAPAQKAPAQKAPAAKTGSGSASNAQAKPATKSGGSQIGANFLDGVTGGTSTNRAAKTASAAEIGPAVKASLASSISRQLKPRWQAPQGPDAEELVTVLSFNLNRDGTLAGTPTVVRQLGINDLNRNQAARHAEQAIRAVRLAAPFDLPEEYYAAWKRVSAFRFDKRLSQ